MQYSFSSGELVDAIVKIGDFIIPIDAKFSLDNYNKMIESEDKTEIESLETKFKDDIKKRIDETAKYILPNEKTTDYNFWSKLVVIFHGKDTRVHKIGKSILIAYG